MPAIAIHAHFYQPSREDPWSGTWPSEASASPWHNWNDRIADECYGPNAAARLLDAQGRTRDTRNNYAHLSFDTGPTLLQWMEVHRPVLLRALRRSDEHGAIRFGRGGAIAQAYHHAILPLCDAHDRRLEIAWGLEDFQLRYGRPAEGFWLPEAAVDTPTLCDLADAGVRFVILAGHQLQRVRPSPSSAWRPPDEVPHALHRAYEVPLPGGRSIAAFFYDPALSHGIAFDGLLHDGEALAQRLIASACEGPGDGLLHLATDGESYGHHHGRGEMALARALEIVSDDPRVTLTNHASWLADHPPTWQAQIVEQTSWSCAHGIERWRADCGCRDGDHPEFHQAWRGPLREALEHLRDAVRPQMLRALAERVPDPDALLRRWPARLVAQPSAPLGEWLAAHGGPPQASEPELREIHTLLEIQRHLLAMFTSCAWFFDDLDRLEPRQVLRHAACVLGLGEHLWGEDPCPQFLDRVRRLPGNGPTQPLVDLVEEHRSPPPRRRGPHLRSVLETLPAETAHADPSPLDLPDLFPRRAGLLLHPTSLPGPGVSGDLDHARDHIDWMVTAGLEVWQVLPLCPPGPGHSPYSSWSSLSGNPLLLGLRWLVRIGFLEAAEIEGAPEGPYTQVDPTLVSTWKAPLLERAARRLLHAPNGGWADALQRWRDRNPWVEDAALFRVLQRHHGAPWTAWPEPLALRDPDAVAAFAQEHREAVETWVALCFLFDRQWGEVHTYASARGVRLLGDLPIYVGPDSADVWAHRDLFQLDERGHPSHVAGVPPDAFSDTGQRWGNPLYDWDALRARGYAWWVDRLRRALTLTDLVRLDHFIGFVRYWAIPASDPDATHGAWRPGPGAALFHHLEQHLGTLPLVLEDLGDVGPDVRALREALGYPGMRVVQFAFDGDPANEHLPAHHPERSVVYLGTHDNDTALGWWNTLTPQARADARARFSDPSGPPAEELCRLTLHSPATWAILTAQDILGLDSGSRMNTPGVAEGNWRWRVPPHTFTPELASQVRRWVEASCRLPPTARFHP